MIFQYTTQKRLVLLGRHRPLHLNSKRKGYYFCHTLYNIILCRSIFISVLKNRNDEYLPLDPNTNTIKLLPLHSIIMKKKKINWKVFDVSLILHLNSIVSLSKHPIIFLKSDINAYYSWDRRFYQRESDYRVGIESVSIFSLLRNHFQVKRA